MPKMPVPTPLNPLLRYPLEGHYGHAQHCLFCYVRYCLFGIAKGPPPRLSAAQQKERYKKRFWIRILSRGFIFLLGLALAVLAFYHCGWTLVWAIRGQATMPVLEKSGRKKEEEWKEKNVKFGFRDRVLWFSIFLLVSCPMAICVGFVSAGIYYIRKYRKKQKEKEVMKATQRLKELAKENASPSPSSPSRNPEAPNATSSSNTGPDAAPSSYTGNVPAIEISRADTVRPPPQAKAPSFRGTVMGYWEDLSYQWKPQGGYVGTEQRRSNFLNDGDGFEMSSLSGGGGGGGSGSAQAHRLPSSSGGGGAGNELGIFVVEEGGSGNGNETGTGRRDRESTMTIFPFM